MFCKVPPVGHCTENVTRVILLTLLQRNVRKRYNECPYNLSHSNNLKIQDRTQLLTVIQRMNQEFIILLIFLSPILEKLLLLQYSPFFFFYILEMSCISSVKWRQFMHFSLRLLLREGCSEVIKVKCLNIPCISAQQTFTEYPILWLTLQEVLLSTIRGRLNQKGWRDDLFAGQGWLMLNNFLTKG